MYGDLLGALNGRCNLLLMLQPYNSDSVILYVKTPICPAVMSQVHSVQVQVQVQVLSSKYKYEYKYLYSQVRYIQIQASG